MASAFWDGSSQIPSLRWGTDDRSVSAKMRCVTIKSKSKTNLFFHPWHVWKMWRQQKTLYWLTVGWLLPINSAPAALGKRWQSSKRRTSHLSCYTPWCSLPVLRCHVTERFSRQWILAWQGQTRPGSIWFDLKLHQRCSFLHHLPVNVLQLSVPHRLTSRQYHNGQAFPGCSLQGLSHFYRRDVFCDQ